GCSCCFGERPADTSPSTAPTTDGGSIARRGDGSRRAGTFPPCPPRKLLRKALFRTAAAVTTVGPPGCVGRPTSSGVGCDGERVRATLGDRSQPSQHQAS